MGASVEQTSSVLIPDWPAPKGVSALVTTRIGGSSKAPYLSFNLGDHVGDSEDAVASNRKQLLQLMNAGAQCQWLQQVHGTEVVKALPGQGVLEADAAYTDQSQLACLVMTADCLPVLFCDRSATQVAAAHAGWRGLADGVLEATVAKLDCPVDQLMCWLGPAIGPDAFEVGAEVRQQFCDQYAEAEQAFKMAEQPGKWLADLYLLATQRLQRLGITSIYGGNFCTYQDSERFFSYRRDGVTGRMASLIWLTDDARS
ncbi:MAG: peptidoglycan editing factor PgeF [Motiliproteus sp.]|nr:peptidoglycan editing factor PgeF [Motiliproteus sp.]MCW9052306.1 peptidoglycan editing factor PgeF [Motiliproteus sp.]